MSGARIAITAIAIALLASGVALYERNELNQARAELAAIARKRESVPAQTPKPGKSDDEPIARAAPAELLPAPPPADPALHASVSAMVTRIAKTKQFLQEMPQFAIPELALLSDEDWVAALNGLPLENEGQMRWALSEARSAAKRKFSKLLVAALAAYSSANNGALPDDLEAVAPFFKQAVDPGAFKRYEVLQKGDFTAVSSGGRDFIADRPDSKVDDVYDTRWRYGIGGWSGGQVERNASVFHNILARYRETNGDRTPGAMEDLRPYIPAPIPASFDLSTLESFLVLEQKPLPR